MLAYILVVDVIIRRSVLIVQMIIDIVLIPDNNLVAVAQAVFKYLFQDFDYRFEPALLGFSFGR